MAAVAPSALAPTAGAAIVPVEGPWQATTSAGLPVTFEVTAGHVAYPIFQFNWGFCGTYASSVGTTVPINANGHWRYESGGPWVEATFVAPDRAEGTVIAPSRETPGCPETRATFVAEPGGKPFDPGPAVIRTQVGDPQARASRPHTITLKRNGSFRLLGLRWRDWGKPTAHGSGRAVISEPCRGCRNGERIWRPRVKVRLNELTQERTFRIYLDLRYELLGPVPPHFHRSYNVYL